MLITDPFQRLEFGVWRFRYSARAAPERTSLRAVHYGYVHS